MSKKEKKKPTELEKAVSQTKLAAIMAFVSTGVNLVLTAITMASAEAPGPGAADAIGYIIMALLTAGLGVGLLFKSRACAIGLFALFCVDKIVAVVLDPGSVNIATLAVSAAIWGVVYWNGITGAYRYHKLINLPPEPVQEPEPEMAGETN